MTSKLMFMALVWGGVIFAYILLGFIMPSFLAITETASVGLSASANMSNFPGTLEAVDSAPLWIWFVPGTVGIVVTTMELVRRSRTSGDQY